MRDRYVILIIAACVGLMIGLFTLLIDRRPVRTVGLPAGSTCGYEDDGVRTCVGDGVVYTCVTNWRSRVRQCAPTPRSER